MNPIRAILGVAFGRATVRRPRHDRRPLSGLGSAGVGAAGAFENGGDMSDADATCLKEVVGAADPHAAARDMHIASGHGDD